MLAELHLAENRTQEALEQVEQVLTDHPNNARAHHTAGLLLDATGQTGHALAYYGRAAELEPNSELYSISYRTARDSAAGIPPLSADSPPPVPYNAQIPISSAVAALRQNLPGQAVELLQPYAVGECEHAQVFCTLGVAYYRLGDYQSSQVALQQALSLDNSSALTYLLMGYTLAKLGQCESAEDYFEQARTMDPTYCVGP